MHLPLTNYTEKHTPVVTTNRLDIFHSLLAQAAEEHLHFAELLMIVLATYAISCAPVVLAVGMLEDLDARNSKSDLDRTGADIEVESVVAT